MSSRTDNFNRADSTTSLGTPSDSGSAWVATQGTWGIATNRGYNPGSDSPGSAYLESSAANADVQVTISVVGAHGGLVFRLSDLNNYWLLDVAVSGTKLRLQKYQSGSFGVNFDFAYTPANGDIIKASFSGSTINCYLNGSVVIGPITDAFNSTATKHGLFDFSENAVRFDDFSIVDTSVAPGGQWWNLATQQLIGGGDPFSRG